MLSTWIRPCLKSYPSFMIQKLALFTAVREIYVSAVCLRDLQVLGGSWEKGGALETSLGPVTDEPHCLPFFP